MKEMFDFIFDIVGVEASLTVHDWGWVNIPVVGDYVYLHDFLEDSHENVTIDCNDQYNNANINEYLVNYKFRIDERIFVQVNGKIRHMEYRVTAIDK